MHCLAHPERRLLVPPALLPQQMLQVPLGLRVPAFFSEYHEVLGSLPVFEDNTTAPVQVKQTERILRPYVTGRCRTLPERLCLGPRRGSP